MAKLGPVQAAEKRTIAYLRAAGGEMTATALYRAFRNRVPQAVREAALARLRRDGSVLVVEGAQPTRGFAPVIYRLVGRK